MKQIDRRTILAAAAGTLASIPIASAQGQPAAGAAAEKGPRVWLDLDQRELDDAYDQSKYAANIQQLLGRQVSIAETARQHLGPPKRLAYGPTPMEGADLYATKRSNAPIHIFIHGGAWRGGLAKNSGFHAELLVNAG